LALIEVSNLSPALVVADCCSKSAGVRLLGIESTDGVPQCIKLVGSAGDVAAAVEAGVELAQRMGAEVFSSVIPAPLDMTFDVSDPEPVFIPALGCYDNRIPRDDAMTQSNALGLLETQGLVAALHATDDMLKSSNVELVGKEKIGAAFVTIMIRGDVAAVENAIETGRASIERLGGKLIMADVIARPHEDLAKLLP
jgi:ethanolamine utilization protein EutM